MTISGLDKIISIKQFEYLSCIDRHETCFFSAYIKKDDAEAALQLAGSDVSFKDDNFEFAGLITDVIVTYDISGACLEVKTVGKTSLHDQDRFARVFQNRKKTMSDVLYEIETMSDIEYKCDEDPVIENVLFQNNETDWEFVVSLINRFGLHLFPQEKTFIGKYGNDQEIEIEEDSLIDYKLTIGANRSSMICRIDEPLDLGSRVQFSGRHFFVVSKRYVLEGERYFYEYALREITEDSETQPDSTNAYLYAKVTDNNDPDKKGRLQVSFDNQKFTDCCKEDNRFCVKDSCKKNDRVWIDRMDAYAHKGLGPVCIPQIDDIVRVHLYRGDSRIVGCVRTEAYGDPYDNCNDKYLMLDNGVYVQFDGGIITVRNGESHLEVYDREILIEADEKFSINVKGEVSISGNKVNINGKSGVDIN